MNSTTRILAGLTAIALTAAPAAFAVKPDKPDKPDHAVGYVFKDTYSGDGSTVAVTKGNKHVERADLVGIPVAFDFASAMIVTTDSDGDGAETIDDVVVGDEVLVKAKLPKSNPGVAPYAAKKLVDQTHPEEEPAPLPRLSD